MAPVHGKSVARPKDVYKWIENDYQARLVMLRDLETGGPTANARGGRLRGS